MNEVGTEMKEASKIIVKELELGFKTFSVFANYRNYFVPLSVEFSILSMTVNL